MIITITTGAAAEADHVTELAAPVVVEQVVVEAAEVLEGVALALEEREGKITALLGAGLMAAMLVLIQVLVGVAKHHKATLQTMKQETPEPVVLEF